MNEPLSFSPGIALAVASGKGGVGKSTVAVNLAAALAAEGAAVGLLDADLYGPNIPLMLGMDGPLRAENGQVVPREQYGLKVISMGFLIAEDEPLVWRGPKLTAIINEFLRDVAWGDLDYLLVDLPPGTGDVHLSLMGALKLDGAIVVTTPQQTALADVSRNIAMFRQAGVPVLGVIENMAGLVCPHCGEQINVFGRATKEAIEARLGAPILGEIPIDPQVGVCGDDGHPVVLAAPESVASQSFYAIRAKVTAWIPAPV
ncbi:MAG: iron-sulfur cluster carrier protein ApbC [Anaerolineales bacterium]